MGMPCLLCGSWTGYLLIVDAEDLKKNPASEIDVERFTAKDIEVQKVIIQHVYLCASGSIRQEDRPEHSHPRAASNAEETLSKRVTQKEEMTEN